MQKPGRTVVVGLVVLAVVLGGVGLARARGDEDERPRAEVGQLFDHPFAEDPLGNRVDVVTPWARMSVAVGEPRQNLPDLLDGRANVQAPEDGSFVPVDLALPRDWEIPLPATAVPYTAVTTVVLRADGEEYDLSGAAGFRLDPAAPGRVTDDRVYVAVPGRPTDLTLALTTGGRTQVVDIAKGAVTGDRIDELAELPSRRQQQEGRSRSCGRPVMDVPPGLVRIADDGSGCDVRTLMVTPFVDGLGWAEDGRTWLVVRVAAPYGPRLRRPGDPSSFAATVDGTPPTVRLDGEEAVATGRVNDLNLGIASGPSPLDPVQAVFDVPVDWAGGEVAITLRTRTTDNTTRIAEGLPVGITWRTELGRS